MPIRIPVTVEITEADIEKGLRELTGLPVKVDSWLVEAGLDWYGDPAVWVWGILPDGDLDIEDQLTLSEAITGVVRGLAGDEVITYTRFRSTEEQRALSK